MPSEVPVGREALRAGGVADDDRRGHRPAAALLQQLRSVGLDQGGELAEQFAFLGDDRGDAFEGRFGRREAAGSGTVVRAGA